MPDYTNEVGELLETLGRNRNRKRFKKGRRREFSATAPKKRGVKFDDIAAHWPKPFGTGKPVTKK